MATLNEELAATAAALSRSTVQGNSPCPLADAQGRVIGINTVIAGGLALAVPSKAVERFLRLSEERPLGGTGVEAA